jgi:hypothetical protein
MSGWMLSGRRAIKHLKKTNLPESAAAVLSDRR